MMVPIAVLTALCAFAVILTLVRIGMGGMAPLYSRYERTGGCESGTCKTIGKREVQEDEFGVVESEEGTMAVLADGMGKCFGGKVASRIAVNTFQDMFENRNAFYNPQYYFRKAFHSANREILNRLDGERGAASVASVMIRERKLYYAVAGNVKVAVYRNHELVPVTSGHTINVLAKQKYTEGKLTRKDAVSLLEHHRLYNYVGQDGFHEIEFFDTPVSLYGGEYVVLMSDGLYESVKWKEIEDCIEAEGSCQDKALALMEMINQSVDENQDNASAVVLRVR